MSSAALFARGQSLKPRNDTDILLDRQVWKEADALKDVAERAAQSDRIRLRGLLAVDMDGATRWLDEPIHHLEERGLFGSGRP